VSNSFPVKEIYTIVMFEYWLNPVFLRVMRDAPLQFEIVPGKSPETSVVKLSGPLTLLNLFGFQEQLRGINASYTILDFENVPYMDSAGLGMVVNLHVSCTNKGRKVALVGVNPRVLAIFQSTRVDSILKFYGGLEEAEG